MFPFTDLFPPHFWACRGLSLCSVSSVKMGGDCFVDIGGIDDHHCLNFPFLKEEF